MDFAIVKDLQARLCILQKHLNSIYNKNPL